MLCRSQIEEILAGWKSSHLRFEVMKHWGNRIAWEKDDRMDVCMYVMWAFQGRPGKTAWDGFDEDMKGRKTGVLAEFVKAVVNSYPERRMSRIK